MRVLVTGATRNVGRMVVDELLPAGVDVRALTSRPAAAALPPDVEVYEGFIGRPHTVRDALAGVDAMYLAPYPRTARTVADMARAAGVGRIVALSQFNAAEEAASDPGGWWWYAVEHAVEKTGAEWTMLRPGEFMASTLEWADSIRAEGVVRAPFAKTAHASIDQRDIAAVAAVALLADGHAGRRYLLTGPETFERKALVRKIADAIGRDITFEEMSREEARSHMRGNGSPERVDWYLDLLERSEWDPQPALPTVAEILGRPATSFADWLSRHLDFFTGTKSPA
ncbi:NAD(P)H-binding protein [Actinopolymorpha pittospori]|uniref:Uncharacterized protein YbjT (DUF2867 family) n=1 Tax=Actinopolymorpha pittospori TaxID=648752 RepID=A0A927MSU8_9ACTN|nr:NAD(P)H-binding protein [Actinopolymorpha pittospori]MBE1605534.1 uncharacterized protein YbjT (DUF2867 family) [Actinopolymorpha pittospori]